MTGTILFSLLRTAVGSGTSGVGKATNLTENALEAVYALAKRHDMAHLIGHALDKIGWNDVAVSSQTLRKQTMQAVYRCARQ